MLEAFCVEKGLKFQKNQPLSELSTFKIGGPARYVVRPAGEAVLAELLLLLNAKNIPAMLLGRGSNVLFSDNGFNGAIVCFGQDFARIKLQEDGTLFCQSGASLSQLCLFALEHELSGLEFAYGIPGTVGGAVYMNAGAYGGEMKDVLVFTRHMAPDGSVGQYSGEEMALTYRHSAYSDTSLAITGASFRLQPGNKAQIRAKMDDFLSRRKEKQPLEYPSAGSTFKRPSGAFASALIDECGLKGKRVGDAEVSEKHAGFIINAGNATCADVRELICQVQEEVLKKTGHKLACEIKIVENMQ